MDTCPKDQATTLFAKSATTAFDLASADGARTMFASIGKSVTVTIAAPTSAEAFSGVIWPVCRAKIGNRDDERQRRRRKKRESGQIAFRERIFVNAERRDANEQEGQGEQQKAADIRGTRHQRRQIERHAARGEEQRDEETRADRREPVFERPPSASGKEHGDRHAGGIGADDRLHAEAVGEKNESEQHEQGNSQQQQFVVLSKPARQLRGKTIRLAESKAK